MAAPGNKFFIQEKLKAPAPHHASFKALWDTKWAKPVSCLPEQQYSVDQYDGH